MYLVLGMAKLVPFTFTLVGLMTNKTLIKSYAGSVRERVAASPVVAIFSIRYSHILSCEAKSAVVMMMMLATLTVGMMNDDGDCDGMMMGHFLHM